MKRYPIALAMLCSIALSACSSGPVRRVSEPTANIQQLTVRADGSWAVDLRIENFSSIPMRFDSIALALTVGGEAAGTLQAQPALSIGPEAADVATMTLQPSPQARIAIADALARSRNISYTLDGTLAAAPEKAGVRTFKLKRDNSLNPVPGLAGVLR